MLNRIGNKRRLAEKIIRFFPNHKIYIEPFFGIGGIFFNKPKAEYNILNDIDDEVYNFFFVLLNKKDELVKMIKTFPKHQKLLEYFIDNKETDPVKKAFRFLYISNYSFIGFRKTLKVSLIDNYMDAALDNIDFAVKMLQGCIFLNKDFRDFFKSISAKREEEYKKTFVYCDPPYIDSNKCYTHDFKKKDFIDLLNILIDKPWKFAISEFANEFVINECLKRNLNIIKIMDRIAIKSLETEILITNYEPQITIFDKINSDLTKFNS